MGQQIQSNELAEIRNLLASMNREMTEIRAELRTVKMQPHPEWVTAKTYAEIVGKTPQTIRNWITEGTLETYKHGKVTMVRASQAALPGQRRSRYNKSKAD